jgi:hypothetical protein
MLDKWGFRGYFCCENFHESQHDAEALILRAAEELRRMLGER